METIDEIRRLIQFFFVICTAGSSISVLLSLIDAIDSAIDTLQSEDVTKLEAKVDQKTWNALSEFNEDTIMDVAKYFYKGGYLWGVRSIVKRLDAISNQLCA